MNRKFAFILALLGSFSLGFAVNQWMFYSVNPSQEFKKVTGIGGIFFKSKDPKKLRDWYRQHLGFNTNTYGTVFEWYQGADSTKKGFSQWSPFKETTRYFEPSTKDFMINFRVDNLQKLVEELRKDSIAICDSIQSFSYGKFIHILDLEGNKLELWEPNDPEYEKLGIEMKSKTTK